MTTITRNLALALLASLTLLPTTTVSASEPHALLLAPGEPYCELPRFGFRSYNIGFGERLTFVAWGGLASRMGLEPGDVIVNMNGYLLNYRGSWNDALRIAVNNGGFVRLAIRDTRTGFLAYRTTYVGSSGPFVPEPHIVAYGAPTSSHIVIGGGPITVKAKW